MIVNILATVLAWQFKRMFFSHGETNNKSSVMVGQSFCCLSLFPTERLYMSTLFQSLSMVTIAEIGDKTQLLSILLAARYRVFFPIFLGVFIATLLNHGIVAWFGVTMGSLIPIDTLHLCASLLFIAIGLWTLIPDDAPQAKETSMGAFAASLIAFFIAEMGDKTQLATLTLAASHPDTFNVILGTTLGMLIANAPAILLGETIIEKLPLRSIRITTCLLFVGYGVYGLMAQFI